MAATIEEVLDPEVTDRSTTRPPLPQGIGKLTRGWGLFMAVALAATAFGAYAFAYQQSEGEIVTGLRDVGTMGGAPWGLYITFLVYFVGVSFAGITIAALIRLFNLERLRPLARMAELLTVVSLVLATIAILADLGQPLRGIVNLFRYARPQSPFFGTFTLVIAGYLFASLVYLYLGSRRDAAIMAKSSSRLQWLHRFVAAGYTDTPAERARHERATFWLALAILPMLVIAHSTLGFVFGLQVGRPGWFSALQAPAFVVLAGVSGIGLLIVLAAIVRSVCNERESLDEYVFSWLARFLTVLTMTYLYFVVTELLTATYTGGGREGDVTDAMLTGDYAWIFWGSMILFVGSLAALLDQHFAHRWSIKALVAIGVAVNLAAIGKRFLIVVPSQTDGMLLPYETGSYTPTWVEYGVVLGLFGLGAAAIAIFMKLIPIVELPEEVETDAS
jgi:molybdopterin-containing oxidoreductase family membrane subunit